MVNFLSLQLINVGGSIELSWLAKFIGILIGAVGITGIGIILYCLILKVIVLPLDIWQKVSMRKQSNKMEDMRGQLEKLQKQYANTPDLYQKKVQEVYKQNGYSMFSSCVPMIATLVILIIAFNSLTTYSQSMNLEMYKGMAQAYNAVITTNVDEDAPASVWEQDDKYNKYESTDESKYIYFIALKTDKNEGREYYVNAERLQTLHPEIFEGKEQAQWQQTAETYIKSICSKAAAEEYSSRKTNDNQGISFLLTQNIFYPDVAWKHPLESYENFQKSITKEIVLDGTKEKVNIDKFIDKETYNLLTADLEQEKNSPNGYFILVVLTILSNVGSQLIMMKSQKAQRELQSADETSKNMSKWMTFLMPVLFCVFAFIYSAAFSLYLITSSLFSLITTVIVNKIIDGVFNKQREKVAKIQAGGRQAYSRDWEANARIRAEREQKNGTNKKGK